MSQTPSSRHEANASVSGKVTINGNPTAGVVVGMRLVRPEQTSPTYRATTNEDGIYRISNIASGNYQVAPAAPGMLIADVDNSSGQGLVISEGDNVEGIDFNLIRGGVVTGKITDANGRPLIEQAVALRPVDAQNQRGGDRISGGLTDDRGIYRMFGIRPGHYKVLVAEARRPDRDRPQPLPLTYYPDVTDSAKATVIDVQPGGEASNIDIKIGSPLQTFSVSGRVVDSETGNPVPKVTISLERLVGPDSYQSEVDRMSDQQGQFRVPNLQPGKYLLSVNGGEGSDLQPQGPNHFEVVDSDVVDLLVKTSRGAQISGDLVYEGTSKETIAGTYVYMSVRDPSDPRSNFSGSMYVEPDGRFRSSGGLQPGVVSFSVNRNGRYLNLRRIERDGVVQPNGISIQKGEHISGLRLFVSYSNGSISGTVKIINGVLPPRARLMVTVTRPESQEPQSMSSGAQADARGHFLLEGLAAGSYELAVVAYVPDSRTRPATSKQTINVTDGAVTEVMVTLDLTPPVGP
jgi:protocatechuate 3,4-dioxygenase beta subunit